MSVFTFKSFRTI